MLIGVFLHWIYMFSPECILCCTAIDHNLSDWHTTDIEVKIKETHDNTELIYQTGVIRSISVSSSRVVVLVSVELLSCKSLLAYQANWCWLRKPFWMCKEQDNSNDTNEINGIMYHIWNHMVFEKTTFM